MIKKQILEVIKKHNNFLIAAHINPEGDAIGCQMAMAKLLRAMGKNIKIINEHPVPKNLMFMPQVENIIPSEHNSRSDENFDAAIIMDSPSLERIGKVKNIINDAVVINIDHHISNTQFGSLNWVDDTASSVGEMVYELFKTAGVELDKESALYIYVAIMTDTGSFRYSNTSPKTHEIAAELMRYDIIPNKIYEAVYETKSFETFKLLAEVLANLKRTEDGKFVWFNVTCEMLQRNNLNVEATEDFIDFVRMTEGAQVIAFLRELETKDAVKVSFRSKSTIDVNELAKRFGGGGHPAASGCLIKGKIQEAEKLLIEAVESAIREG